VPGTDKAERIHIWHPDCKRIFNGDAHTHPYELHSEVLVGTIWNDEFEPLEAEGGKCVKTEVVVAKGSPTIGSFHREHRRLPGMFAAWELNVPIKEGNVYLYPRARFHRARSTGLAVTWMRKDEFRIDEPTIILSDIDGPGRPTITDTARQHQGIIDEALGRLKAVYAND